MKQTLKHKFIQNVVRQKSIDAIAKQASSIFNQTEIADYERLSGDLYFEQFSKIIAIDLCMARMFEYQRIIGKSYVLRCDFEQNCQLFVNWSTSLHGIWKYYNIDFDQYSFLLVEIAMQFFHIPHDNCRED